MAMRVGLYGKKINRELRHSKYGVLEDFFKFPGQTREQMNGFWTILEKTGNYCIELQR